MHLLHFFFSRGRSKIACLYHGVNLQKETESAKIHENPKENQKPASGSKGRIPTKRKKRSIQRFSWD